MSIKIRNVFTDSAGGWNVSRADLLAAVETACGVRMVPVGAIVIERAELPLIEPLPSQDSSDSVFVDGVVYDLDSPEPGWHRAEALRRLALAEYLDAHPPVDEAQARAVSHVLASYVARWECNDNDLARQLVAWGVRVDLP